VKVYKTAKANATGVNSRSDVNIFKSLLTAFETSFIFEAAGQYRKLARAFNQTTIV